MPAVDDEIGVLRHRRREAGKLLVRRLTVAARWKPEAAAAVACTIVKARSSGECNKRGARE
jgi:hypothetical protein